MRDSFFSLSLFLSAAALLVRAADLTVDVGYAKYRGALDSNSGLNVWKGIRYAAPPLDSLRFQAPRPPPKTTDSVIDATVQPPVCPQSGVFGLGAEYGFPSGPGDEDCLFLNVYADPGASNLPVFVFIHGGGYSLFAAYYDPSGLLNANRNGFVVVEIQYRLGAFGFLAGEQVKKRGELNAGLLDMRFALQWVQEHIGKFGGDPRRVTVGGESAGGGAAGLLSLAYGGKEEHLFNNIIAASPYSPAAYHYDDHVPSARYRSFVEATGCGRSKDAFGCLVRADTAVLQNASIQVATTNGYWGNFVWLPVVDGDFLRERPSEQLAKGKVSGKRMLSGNNANEGVPLVNLNVTTQDAYREFVAAMFPLFGRPEKEQLSKTYHVENAAPGDNGVRYDTPGDGKGSLTALTQSSFATGLQQAVLDIGAETLFCCPSYWLSDAFSWGGRQAWKYQYSVTPSYHGADLDAYFTRGGDSPSPGFQSAFRKVWGSFIMYDSPIISAEDARGGNAASSVPTKVGRLDWPQWDSRHPVLMSFNTTGGQLRHTVVTSELEIDARIGEGQSNVFKLGDADKWEGGRGPRCRLWRQVSAKVPQ